MNRIVTKQILLLLLVGGMSCFSAMAKNRTQKPNFIIIYTDDQQFNGVGVNGNSVIQTPAMDQLAKRGIRFTNANVAFSLCSPSRAALLTGRYGSANGVLALNSRLNEGEKTLADYLKAKGYTTGMFGKWHIPQKPAETGFDQYAYFYSNGTYYHRKIVENNKTLKPEKHCDTYCAERSIEFLEAQSATEEPFFLFYCSQTPHMNGRLIWDAKEETKVRYQLKDIPVPENRLDDLTGKPDYLKKVRNRTKAKEYGYPDRKAIQNHTLDYYSVITELDNVIDRIVKKVDELGLLENTYLVFMSDNGWQLGDHGFTSKVLPYEVSTKVPMWIVGPTIQPSTSEALVSNIDICSTFLELADCEIPSVLHGESLVPLLKKPSKKVRDAFVYEGLGVYGGAKPNLTIITDRYRYIETYSDESLSIVEYTELYDRELDSSEMHNLSQEPKYSNLIRRLKKSIDKHKQRVNYYDI